MPKEWLQCYEAGIWTEFMEQRAPGHTAGGERIFHKGVLDIKEEIKHRMAQLDKSDPAYEEKLEELKAMDIAADALLIYAQRYAEKLEQLAQEETNVDRKAELYIWLPFAAKYLLMRQKPSGGTSALLVHTRGHNL